MSYELCQHGRATSNVEPAVILPSCGMLIREAHYTPGSVCHSKEPSGRLCLVIAGSARWECGDRRCFPGVDNLCHIPAGQKHVQQSFSKDAFIPYIFYYRPDLLNTALHKQLNALGVITVDLMNTSFEHCKMVRSIFQEILFEQSAAKQGWETMLHSRLMDLVVRILRLAGRQGRTGVPTLEQGNESVERVAQYVHRLKSQFSHQENIAEAARSVGLSRRQFTELFRKVIGQPWRQYVLNLRIKNAAHLLAESDLSVSGVAFESGFEDLSNFHRYFKRFYSCSPLVYREQRRVTLHVEASTSRPHVPTPRQPAGFRFRGMKGWSWTPQQYLEEIPTLAGLRMNFLMNCYRSLTTFAPGNHRCNEWWKPLSEERKQAFAQVASACAQAGIDFCFGMHPEQASPRPLNPSVPGDIELFSQHYEWMQTLGVRWFSICLDHVSWDDGGPSSCGEVHAALVNAIFDRLTGKDKRAQLILCPALFWGDGTNPEHDAYLSALGRNLHPDAYVFWSGDAIVTPRVTRVAAESYRSIVQHRLFLWDNYPVNDASPTLHLGALRGRDPDLCDVIDGYLSNPMCAQNQINRIPLSTCADYACNPKAYNPARSIGQAVQRLGSTPAQQQALKNLIEIYPGFIVAGGGTGTNPVRRAFTGLLGGGSTVAARDFLQKVSDVLSQLAKAFPDCYEDARRTVRDDIDWMRTRLPQRGFTTIEKQGQAQD